MDLYRLTAAQRLICILILHHPQAVARNYEERRQKQDLIHACGLDKRDVETETQNGVTNYRMRGGEAGPEFGRTHAARLADLLDSFGHLLPAAESEIYELETMLRS